MGWRRRTHQFRVGDHHLLLFLADRIALYEQRFQGEGVQSGVVHQARIGGWSGRKDLHLLGGDAQFLADEALQLPHLAFPAAGMGGDQVVGQKLLFPGRLGHLIEHLLELHQTVRSGFAHLRHDTRVGVFGGDLHLPGNVMVHHLAQVVPAMGGVGQHQVVADAGGDEGFLDARDLADAFEQIRSGGDGRVSTPGR